LFAAGSLPAQTKNCLELEGSFFKPDARLKRAAENLSRMRGLAVMVLQQADTTEIPFHNGAVLEVQRPDRYTRFLVVDFVEQHFSFGPACQKLVVNFSASQRVVFFRLRRVSPDLKLVHIPGGTFEMGDQFGDGEEDERPAHTLTVGSFCMSEAEVTNAQFCEFLNDKAAAVDSAKKWLDLDSEFCLIQRDAKGFYVTKKEFAGHPVIEISWHGAKAFCDWLSTKYLAKFRLPSEAEWEYAARGGRREKVKYANGLAAISDTAGNFRGGLPARTAPVRTYGPNPFGLYDMAGNVWEWCENWYDRAAYKKMTADTTSSTGFRALRGGSWLFSPEQVRISSRACAKPDQASFALGFRVVMQCDK
jgi:formylglycine-generating enzyme required for sulfatase activity